MSVADVKESLKAKIGPTEKEVVSAKHELDLCDRTIACLAKCAMFTPTDTSQNVQKLLHELADRRIFLYEKHRTLEQHCAKLHSIVGT